MPFEVVSDRLGLVRFVDEDAPALARIIGDPGVARTITANVSTAARQLEVARQRILWHNQFWDSEGLGVWSMRTRRSPAEIIGWAGFVPAHTSNDAEILYGVGTAWWGHGYASEAALAVADWLYANTARPGICASIFAGNPASERIAEKLGMTRQEDRPIAEFVESLDEVENVVAYDLWRLEFASDVETADEIGHRIGQMTGAMLDRDEVWARIVENLERPELIAAVESGFDRGRSNPSIMFFRVDRP